MGRFWLAVVISMAALSCTSYRFARQAEEAAKGQNWDAAVYYLLEALAEDPSNIKLKMDLQRARTRAAEEHFRRGLAFREAGELARARLELELAVQLDPTHQYAETELAKVRKDLAILAQEGGQAKLEEAKRAAREMKVKPPILTPETAEPMSLSFPNPVNVRDIYNALGKAFGFNVLFDPKLRDTRIAIELKNVKARQALDSVAQAAQHFYKVLDEKTIIVAEDTPQNRRDYEDLVVKTFFLSNADVKDVNNMIRLLFDARRVATNEQLNSLVIRDTADKVAIAERLIAANDKSKAEVLVSVELLQVDSSKLRDIGTSLSSYSFPITLDPRSITGKPEDSRIPLPRLDDITRSMWGVVVPNLTINLIKSAGQAETLAQPELRITEGEKGSVIIGDRVPIPTTTFNTTQTVGGNIVPITAFQYQDVGIKINVEPRVHHNNEITLKLEVEVSELGESVEVAQGQRQPKIGTRTIKSVIRLKDGETSLLAGLLRYTKRESRSGLPWLSDLPVIGGLFRSAQHDFKKTDLILTLTPHIIRNPDITEEDLAPIWVGTETRISVSGASPRVQGPTELRSLQEALSKPPQEEELPEAPQQPLTFPEEQKSEKPNNAALEPEAGRGDALPSVRAAAATPGQGLELPRVAFFPQRLPVVLGQDGAVVVILEAGSVGVEGPLHFAYDPARLEVVRVEGGDVQTDAGIKPVNVTHTPILGWLTVSFSGTATGTSTLLKLSVHPKAAGELPLIFAGPLGAVVGQNGTVVALPVGAGNISQ
ncbi:MAG: secretin N-terminal domain-containing protein [Thermoanaerobaculaceae bacterium]